MASNIERLLKLTADYHKFCSDDFKKANFADPDELNVEDLYFVAAATGIPVVEPIHENEKKDLL